MVKKIVWTLRAQQDRKKILLYWIHRNKSSTYSLKLDKIIKDSLLLISKFPEIGKSTDDENIRIKVVKDYYIFYEESEMEIFILTIWDSRRNPDNIELK